MLYVQWIQSLGTVDVSDNIFYDNAVPEHMVHGSEAKRIINSTLASTAWMTTLI